MDRVLAESGAYCSLPARKERILPGCPNLRLGRWVGDRLARQAVLFDRAFPVDSVEGRLLCDVDVPASEMDGAIDGAVASLTSFGVVSAAANCKTLRAAQESLALFQAFMVTYAREQAFCHFSPALVRNLEQYWMARRDRAASLHPDVPRRPPRLRGPVPRFQLECRASSWTDILRDGWGPELARRARRTRRGG
jgi:thioesterase DpgC